MTGKRGILLVWLLGSACQLSRRLSFEASVVPGYRCRQPGRDGGAQSARIPCQRTKKIRSAGAASG